MNTRSITCVADFHRHLVAAIRRQGIRPTARKLGWHPSKVSRAIDDFRGLSLFDVVDLAHALDARITFTTPDLDALTPALRGRPPASFADFVG